MKNLKKKIIITLMFIVLVGIAICSMISAPQPTQQFNKIYLNPFYLSSMSNNLNYTFNVSISPPDKISQVVSSIISFDVYITPTVTFTLWVNNQSCNNPTYVISTTFASSGQARISFDCSNIINRSGFYNIKLRPTQANTGAVNGWLDLTYMNKPMGTIDLKGTEYIVGQQGKSWLQLLDANRSYINNGVCYLDVYTPTQSIFVEGAVMTNMNRDGIYYYDFNPVPSTEGVYPSIAKCFYTAGTTSNFGTTISFLNGTLDSRSLNDTRVLDASYMFTTESPAGVNPRRYLAEIKFNNAGSICSNISELLLTGIVIDWTGRWNSNVGTDNMKISIYNHTSATWIELSNVIIGVGVGVKTVSNSLLFNNISKMGLVNASGSDLRLKFEDTNLSDVASTGLDYDYLDVKCSQLLSPIYEEIKGSSEMHISLPVNLSSINITIVNNTAIAESTWTYVNRTLTYYPPENNITSDEIWNFVGRNLTYYADTTNYTKIVSDVWNYINRTLTFYPTSLTAQEVWEYVNRNLTYYQVNNITPSDVWNYVNRNLTYYVLNNITPQDIWNYVNRSLTYYELDNLTLSDIWNYNNRSLTYYEVTNVNETAISLKVWENSNRTLTYYEINNISVDDIWNYTNRTLTYYQITDINESTIAIGVWNYTSRNLTYYILTNISAYDIWHYSVRNLTQDLITTPSTIVVYGGSYPIESLNLTSLQAQNVNGSTLFSLTSQTTVGFFENMKQKYGNWLYYSIMIIVSMMLILMVVVITKRNKWIEKKK